MKSRLLWVFVFPFLALFWSQAQTYDTELQLGVAAYKNNQYEKAVDHFQKATDLDPGQPIVHLYLATAYVSLFIPGVLSQENEKMAEQAIAQYQFVLDSGADRSAKIASAKGIAYLYLNMNNYEAARQYYDRASDLNPDDPEDYYSLGVIDWTSCYQPRIEARAKLGLRPEENLRADNAEQKRVCNDLWTKNRLVIEHGIYNLEKAIQLRPDYDDAMAYLNLMYHERADLECDSPAARAQDLKTADEWVAKTLAVKKAKAQATAPAQKQDSGKN